MNSIFYERILRPVFFQFDPERVHHIAMRVLGLAARGWLPPGLLGGGRARGPEREVFGVRFPNPVGLAAGFDKDAEVLPAWEALGFGFVEVGTVTAKPQPGNPRPRLFRIPERQALINRMGFNNDGAEAVAARLDALRQAGRWPKQMPVGINLGKSKVTPLDEAPADYAFSFRRLEEFGDYFVVNVSSPNTPGLRSLQEREALEGILRAVQDVNTKRKPLLVKIAPDLGFQQIEEVVTLAHNCGLAGIVATNTTLDHSSVPAGKDETGGLSGRPLQARSTEIVRFIREQTKLPVIASGGVMDAASALEKVHAGAALVQIYTGFIYRGPGLIREICNALEAGPIGGSGSRPDPL